MLSTNNVKIRILILEVDSAELQISFVSESKNTCKPRDKEVSLRLQHLDLAKTLVSQVEPYAPMPTSKKNKLLTCGKKKS